MIPRTDLGSRELSTGGTFDFLLKNKTPPTLVDGVDLFFLFIWPKPFYTRYPYALVGYYLTN
jgi:hypothetical protein